MSDGSALAAIPQRRDVRRDGWLNRLEDGVLRGFKPLWELVNRQPVLARALNRLIIDVIVSKAPGRPLALSTMASYTSWPSLTDRTWFSRYLPPRPMREPPPLDDVVDLFKVRPSGPLRSQRSTLLFPAFAQWFTDGFLMTEDGDRRRTRTNHQVDLSQLYGLTSGVTLSLRALSEAAGEKGRLKVVATPDGDWAPKLYDDRGVKRAEFAQLPDPVNMPLDLPAERKASMFAFGGERTNSTVYTSAINTLFLREHNRLCALIEAANPDWDDERVFETVRNIGIVQLIRIVIGEYINHISPFWLKLNCDPTGSYGKTWYREGWIPLEFNILYRLHSLVPDQLTWSDETLGVTAMLMDNRRLQADGLGQAFDSASRTRAGRAGLFNTADALVPVERLTVHQSRANGISSYNDYREIMHYPRVTGFDQISSDPLVLDALERVYGDVDRIEFYVGLLAEDVPARAAVPPLLGRMVAVDAFSHLLTNPLLSQNVYNEATFSREGLHSIDKTSSLRDLVDRNVSDAGRFRVSMEQEERGASSI